MAVRQSERGGTAAFLLHKQSKSCEEALAEVHRLSPDFLWLLWLSKGCGFVGGDHGNQFLPTETRHDGVHRGL